MFANSGGAWLLVSNQGTLLRLQLQGSSVNACRSITFGCSRSSNHSASTYGQSTGGILSSQVNTGFFTHLDFALPWTLLMAWHPIHCSRYLFLWRHSDYEGIPINSQLLWCTLLPIQFKCQPLGFAFSQVWSRCSLPSTFPQTVSHISFRRVITAFVIQRAVGTGRHTRWACVLQVWGVYSLSFTAPQNGFRTSFSLVVTALETFAQCFPFHCFESVKKCMAYYSHQGDSRVD